jgi:hypothetical protein
LWYFTVIARSASRDEAIQEVIALQPQFEPIQAKIAEPSFIAGRVRAVQVNGGFPDRTGRDGWPEPRLAA